MGPLEYEITDFEDPPPDLPFVVPIESLLVASGADDGRLAGLLEQVDYVLLSLRGHSRKPSLLGHRGRGRRAALLQLYRPGRRV